MHSLGPSTCNECLPCQVRAGEGEQDLPVSYLQEIAPLAVDVYKVVVYREELLRLPNEESGTVQLGLVCGEGELPLCTQHVDAAWRK